MTPRLIALTLVASAMVWGASPASAHDKCNSWRIIEEKEGKKIILEIWEIAGSKHGYDGYAEYKEPGKFFKKTKYKGKKSLYIAVNPGAGPKIRGKAMRLFRTKRGQSIEEDGPDSDPMKQQFGYLDPSHFDGDFKKVEVIECYRRGERLRERKPEGRDIASIHDEIADEAEGRPEGRDIASIHDEIADEAEGRPEGRDIASIFGKTADEESPAEIQACTFIGAGEALVARNAESLGLDAALRGKPVGIRSKSETVPIYELLEGEVFPSKFEMSLSESAGKLLSFKPRRRPRIELLGEDKMIEVFPVTLDSPGPVAIRSDDLRKELPLMTILVFGGRFEAANAELDLFETYLGGLNKTYRLQIEYHAIMGDFDLAAPETYPSLAAFVRTVRDQNRESSITGDDAIRLTNDGAFDTFLGSIAMRLKESPHTEIDHVFLLKYGFTVPERAAPRFGEFLDDMAKLKHLPHAGPRALRWITVVSGAMNAGDLSNAYLAQPLSVRVGRGDLLTLVSSTDAEKGEKLKRFDAERKRIGGAVSRLFNIKLALNGIKPPATIVNGVLNGGEIFESTGILFSGDALKSLNRAVGVFLESREKEEVEDAGTDHARKRLAQRLLEIAELPALPIGFAGPDWMNAQVGSHSDADAELSWRSELNKFAADLQRMELAADKRHDECSHFYIRLLPHSRVVADAK